MCDPKLPRLALALVVWCPHAGRCGDALTGPCAREPSCKRLCPVSAPASALVVTFISTELKPIMST